MLTGGDRFEIDNRTSLLDEILKQRMGLFDLFFDFGACPVGSFAEHGDGSLVFTSGYLFVVDIVLFQQPVEIGNLGDHADRADHGEGCREYPAGNTSHQITSTGRHLVDGYRDMNTGVAKAHDLRGREAIGMDHAAGAFKTHDDFVTFAHPQQNGSDLLAQ